MHASIDIVEALWISHPVMEISLAGIMYRRKLHRKFPVFFAYILFQLLQFFILFPIFRSDHLTEYFFAYWLSALVCWVFGFKIIQEVFLDVCRPFHALKDMGTVMKWTGLVLLLLLLCSVLPLPGQVDCSLLNIMIGLERCVRLTQCALVLFLLLVFSHLGVSWRRHSIGIALGFGWFAGVELIDFLLYPGSQIPEPSIDLHNINLLNTAAYSLALIVWACYAAISVSNDLPNFQTGGRAVAPGSPNLGSKWYYLPAKGTTVFDLIHGTGT